MASQPRKRSEPRTKQRLRQAVRAAVRLRFGDPSQFDPHDMPPSLPSLERAALRICSWILSISPKAKLSIEGTADVAAWVLAMQRGALVVGREAFAANIEGRRRAPTAYPRLKPGTRTHGRLEFYNVWYAEAEAAGWLTRVRNAAGYRVVYEVLKLEGMGPIPSYSVARRYLRQVVATVRRLRATGKAAKVQRAQRLLDHYPLIADHLSPHPKTHR